LRGSEALAAAEEAVLIRSRPTAGHGNTTVPQILKGLWTRQFFTSADDPTSYFGIKVGSTAKAFGVEGPNDPLGTVMSGLAAGDFHKDRAGVREVLCHRIGPGFRHRVNLPTGGGEGEC
jgi:hypothetical protein